MVAVVLQKEPAAQGVLDVEPRGQYAPVEQLAMVEGVEQNEPAGHLASVVDAIGQ